MVHDEIKFQFDIEVIDKYKLDAIFKKIGSLLNIQFDENLNPYPLKNNDVYLFKNVSKKDDEFIENEINSFFNYAYDNIIDKQPYKFLVLKNKDKLIILANISSKIFDYTSINTIHDLFQKPIQPENKLINQHNIIKNYLS